jgi:hypothetical protein
MSVFKIIHSFSGGIEPRALHVLAKYSPTEPHPQQPQAIWKSYTKDGGTSASTGPSEDEAALSHPAEQEVNLCILGQWDFVGDMLQILRLQ